MTVFNLFLGRKIFKNQQRDGIYKKMRWCEKEQNRDSRAEKCNNNSRNEFSSKRRVTKPLKMSHMKIFRMYFRKR